MEIPQLPYRTDYAKSGRANCRKCKDPITKNCLRLAVVVQSPFFDGKQPNWYHVSCFFEKFKPKDVSQIEYFDSLRWDDQELIRKEISKLTSTGSSVNGTKSKKRGMDEANDIPDLNDYTVCYAKSSKSTCRVCEEHIGKKEVRVSKKDYEDEVALQFGPIDRWHHVDCFIRAREELGFFASAEILPGFNDLSSEDQEMLKSKIPKINRTDTTDGPSSPKKPKDDISKSQLKKQTERIFKYRDELESLTKKELTTLFQYNNQDVPEGIPSMLDRLSDAMAFGALKRCNTCQGQLTFSTGLGYQCLGDVSEWAKCTDVYLDPARVRFKIPEDLKEGYSFLKNYKGAVGKRIFVQTISPVKIKNPEVPVQSKSVFESLKFFIHKTENKSAVDLRKKVEKLGGEVVKKMEDVFAVISTDVEVQKPKLTKPMKAAKDQEIHVLPETFFDEVTIFTSKEELISKINEKKISPWGADPSNKIKENPTSKLKSVYPSKSSSQKSSRYKSKETVKTVTVKGGVAVDPDSNLEKVAHVYRRGKEVFSVVLSETDVQKKVNSYYRLQILESDKKNKYWLFRAWGRIGTTIGGNKVEQYDTLNDCIEVFKDLFLEKTGNEWEMRDHFKKMPSRMMMLDIEYKDQVDDIVAKPKLESRLLAKPVQDLITLIFDIEAMKNTMLEFELDLNKLPLGKISQKQLEKAFSILSEAQNLINRSAEESLFVAQSNMFYTLVPHDTGVRIPPLLNNEDIIKQKIEMLNSLMEIEIAYKMLQECKNNSVDDSYNQLKANITVLDPKSEEFKTIQLYLTNTHAKTHMNYTLDIETVFKVERNGEDKRYDKYCSKITNRKLLWHGSRVTNFVGILSQGLRKAPPEAPVTGYMFGKGIYFADMASKSANYCCTSKKNPTGLVLLCEVAVGNMHELTQAQFIEKLPPGKNSVKGIGKTTPDPSETVTTPEGVEIPLGKGIDANVKNSSLLYNEYIVYNVAQVKIKYLLRLKFNHKM